VQNGDLITLDVANKTLHVALSDQEIAGRKKALKPLTGLASRGYSWLYQQHVQQANLGADLDFLKGGSGSEVLKDSH
jgi:dihydroxy-acid dehydratase